MKHLVDREPENVTIDCRDTTEFVICAITPDPFIDFRQMCDHSFDEWLGKLANAWCCRTKFLEIIDPLGPFALLQTTPETVLHRTFERSSALSHITQLLRSSDVP